MMSHACDPSTWDAERGRLPCFPGHEWCSESQGHDRKPHLKFYPGLRMQLRSRVLVCHAQDPRFDPQHLQNGSWILGPGGTLTTANRKRQWLTQCTQWASRGQQPHFQFIIDLARQMFLRPFTISKYPLQQRRVSPDGIRSQCGSQTR